MELEALQQIHGEVRALGAQIVVLTPELERYTRALRKKLNLSFDILTDLHLKTAEGRRQVYSFQPVIAPYALPWQCVVFSYHDQESEGAIARPVKPAHVQSRPEDSQAAVGCEYSLPVLPKRAQHE
jgi:hypothetical protein